MASNTPHTRFSCNHPGCQKSYLRSEHLNRHTLTHKERAFTCYFCKRKFTRNDLLQAHVRRHEEKAMEIVEKQKRQSPPHQGHRDELLRKSNPLWEENLLPLDPASEGSILINAGNDIHFSTNNLRISANEERSLDGSLSSSRFSVEHYQRLLAEVPSFHLIQIVRDRLTNNPSEIAQEVRKVLDRLLNDDRINSVF